MNAVTNDEQLTARQLAILLFEREWWRYAGFKDPAIVARFAVEPREYYAELNTLIWSDEAEAHDRLLVLRLRRLATARRKAREGRTP